MPFKNLSVEIFRSNKNSKMQDIQENQKVKRETASCDLSPSMHEFNPSVMT